jgi:predicted DsbA family dithiol-disulfide isomerase
MRPPGRTPNTLYSLEATEYAQQQGQFDAFHLAAYKAYWEDGKDLGDIAVIEELALKCGLNWPELSERLDSGYYREIVIAQFQQARGMNIRGIPAFLIGNQLFTGAQPYEIFKLAFARASESMQA